MKSPLCIDIRPFEAAHQQAARDLILAGLAEHWGFLDPNANPDLDEIAQTYRDAHFLLAWAGEALVGTGALIREGEGVGRIVRMSVARGFRRQGIGRRILAALLAAARARGYRQVALETTSTWEEAISFYRQHGFRVLGAQDGDTHFVLDLAP
jgi:ribosomal protein S18 acetylase RimI-like enzyme